MQLPKKHLKKLWPCVESLSMSLLLDLLRAGYFPKGLPPLFDTESFADAVDRFHTSFPNDFTKTKPAEATLTHHSASRPGGLRRRLSIPNPVSFYRISKAFEDHEDLLRAKWELSKFSQTAPRRNEDGPTAISRNDEKRSIPKAIARVDFGKR
jgi:hypothetical protein